MTPNPQAIAGWLKKISRKLAEPLGVSVHAQLYYAASAGHAASVKELLAAGANPDYCSENGLACLHQAVLKGDLQAAAALLAAGADPNKPTDAGWTPLHLCISIPCAAALLEAGADLSLPDKNGLLPEDACATDGLAGFLRAERETRELLLCPQIASDPSIAKERPRI